MPVFIKSWYEKGIKVVQDFFMKIANFGSLEFLKTYIIQLTVVLVWFGLNITLPVVRCNAIAL